MRRVGFIVTLLCLSLSIIAQKTIKMEKDGGIYKISCKVNGAPMKMYFDTGASTVSISKATALYLLENDLIGPQDFRGKTKSTTADGSISDKMVINLRDIEIAGLHLRDVLATVSYSLNAPLLLGQTAIQRLGRITLQGNMLTIHTNASGQNQNKQDRTELDKRLRHLRDTRSPSNRDSDYEILEIIEKLETNHQLNEFELFCKTMSLSNIFKFDDVLSAAQTWLDRYASNTDSIDWKMRVFFTAAEANVMSENGNKEKGMEYLRRCENYWEKITDRSASFFWANRPFIINNYCQYSKTGYLIAFYSAKETVKYFLKLDKLTLSDINNDKCKNWADKICMYSLWLTYAAQYSWNRENNYGSSQHENSMLIAISILAAKVGIDPAIDYLRGNNISYNRTLSRDELNMIGIE